MCCAAPASSASPTARWLPPRRCAWSSRKPAAAATPWTTKSWKKGCGCIAVPVLDAQRQPVARSASQGLVPPSPRRSCPPSRTTCFSACAASRWTWALSSSGRGTRPAWVGIKQSGGDRNPPSLPPAPSYPHRLSRKRCAPPEVREDAAQTSRSLPDIRRRRNARVLIGAIEHAARHCCAAIPCGAGHGTDACLAVVAREKRVRDLPFPLRSPSHRC